MNPRDQAESYDVWLQRERKRINTVSNSPTTVRNSRWILGVSTGHRNLRLETFPDAFGKRVEVKCVYNGDESRSAQTCFAECARHCVFMCARACECVSVSFFSAEHEPFTNIRKYNKELNKEHSL